MSRVIEIIGKIAIGLIGLIFPIILIVTACGPIVDPPSIVDPNEGEFGVLDLTDSLLCIVDSQFVEIKNRKQHQLFYLDSLHHSLHDDEDKIKELNKGLQEKNEKVSYMEINLNELRDKFHLALKECREKERELLNLRSKSIKDSLDFEEEINHLHTSYSRKVRVLKNQIDSNNVELDSLQNIITTIYLKNKKIKI